MLTATELLNRLQALGIKVEVRDGRLITRRPPEVTIPRDLAEAIRAHRDELIALVSAEADRILALEDAILALLSLPQPEAEARAEELRKLAEPIKDHLDPAFLAILEGYRPPEPDAAAEREVAELAWCYALHRPVPQHHWPFIEAMGFSIRQLPPRKDFYELMRRAHMLAERNPNLRPVARSLLRWILSSESDGYLERAFGRSMEFKKCVICGADFVADSGERRCFLCRSKV